MGQANDIALGSTFRGDQDDVEAPDDRFWQQALKLSQASRDLPPPDLGRALQLATMRRKHGANRSLLHEA